MTNEQRQILNWAYMLNESFNDVAAIVVVGASIHVGRVEMTPRERAMAKRNGYRSLDDTKPVIKSFESYYLVDRRQLDDLLGTNLFFSTVDSKDTQLLYKLQKIDPVIVHRTSSSKMSDFGLHESNDFTDNVKALQQIFGADIPVYHFQSSNSLRTRYGITYDDKLLYEDFGMWYKVKLNDSAAGNDRDLVSVHDIWHYGKYSDVLMSKEQSFMDNFDDCKEFFNTMKTKRLGQN